MNDSESKLLEIVERLVYPERFEDTQEWFTGDGPFEEYCAILAGKAEGILKEYYPNIIIKK